MLTILSTSFHVDEYVYFMNRAIKVFRKLIMMGVET